MGGLAWVKLPPSLGWPPGRVKGGHPVERLLKNRFVSKTSAFATPYLSLFICELGIDMGSFRNSGSSGRLLPEIGSFGKSRFFSLGFFVVE